jgi:hypothetical protein
MTRPTGCDRYRRNTSFIFPSNNAPVSTHNALDYGLVGPIARASGVRRDLRTDLPYAGCATGRVSFGVPCEVEGDGYARLRLFPAGAVQSADIIRQIAAAGTCPLTGCVFGPGFSGGSGVVGVIPVDVEVPGCPPPPLALVHALLWWRSDASPRLRCPDRRPQNRSKTNRSDTGIMEHWLQPLVQMKTYLWTVLQQVLLLVRALQPILKKVSIVMLGGSLGAALR